MKNRALYLLTIGFLLTGLISCGEVSQKEYDTLKAENEHLKKENDELKFGPDKILSKAKVFLDDKNFYKAKLELQTLIDTHPASEQATEAKLLITVAENEIQEQKIKEEKVKFEKEQAHKKILINATTKLRIKYDDVSNTTWYYDKSTSKYTNHNSFHLYMGKEKDGIPWLRFRIQYAADDWLFIQSYTIKTDSKLYTISTSYGEVETDNKYGGIWEWYDTPMTKSLYEIVKNVINSKSVKLRCNGKQYHKDRIITEKEKQGLQNILDAYEALGGATSF